MNAALTITGLTKKYNHFTLDHISFSIPSGSIVGLIGENGAGKTTTVNAMLGLIKRDSGKITILGQDLDKLDRATKGKVGVVFDRFSFSEELTPIRLSKIVGEIYSIWDQSYFMNLLSRLNIPAEKKIKAFSKGMKAKLSMAVAFAHRPQLLILDEVTSGLDPIVRDDILDMLLEFVQDEEHSILISSHITSDLEKVADYIVFIHAGRIIFCKPKDELLEHYGIMKCGAAQFEEIDKNDMVAYRRQDYEWQILVAHREKAAKKYPKAMVIPATIDEIMLLYVKGEHE
ncbi:MAG: ABC transporter ATP-binding protein [Lachnospiraceae bacterium]|nr:ABC transporter ATP-binding protein [Lachnospiraceae bacterium]